MEDDFFTSTLTDIPNYNIKESKGFIYSSSSYDISSPVNQLKQKAISKGCNAVINLKILTKENIYLAYGEAVIIQKSDDDILKGAAPSLTEKPK